MATNLPSSSGRSAGRTRRSNTSDPSRASSSGVRVGSVVGMVHLHPVGTAGVPPVGRLAIDTGVATLQPGTSGFSPLPPRLLTMKAITGFGVARLQLLDGLFNGFPDPRPCNSRLWARPPAARTQDFRWRI